MAMLMLNSLLSDNRLVRKKKKRVNLLLGRVDKCLTELYSELISPVATVTSLTSLSVTCRREQEWSLKLSASVSPCGRKSSQPCQQQQLSLPLGLKPSTSFRGRR